MDLSAVREITESIRAEVRKAVVGQDAATDLLLVSLLAGGHALLEGVPGVAKTLLTRAFATSLGLHFGRIQFTPDMMPGDLLGTNLFNFKTNSFSLTKGPIFTQFLLADEINRTPPKTQAAMLQAMSEREVTIDGTGYPLGDDFMVVATQNPIEQQGTYPLPEAQLDRFLVKIVVDYPSRDEELELVRRHSAHALMPDLKELGLRNAVSKKDLENLRWAVAEVGLSEEMIAYVVDIARATRNHPALSAGASPRAANMLAAAARAYAAMQGRDFAIPDDLKYVARAVLRHRVVLSPVAEIDGANADGALTEILNQTPAPR